MFRSDQRQTDGSQRSTDPGIWLLLAAEKIGVGMTISEIAKLAGVSSAAVSRYLNDGSLSQEKRQRIERVIRETKYRPSEYARTMRTKKSNRIGVLVPQIDSESVPLIAENR